MRSSSRNGVESWLLRWCCCGVDYFFEEHNVIAKLITIPFYDFHSGLNHKVNKFKELSYIIHFGF